MDILHKEIQILQRNYSAIRKTQHKWKCRALKDESKTIIIDKTIYLIDDLLKRKYLKRNVKILIKIHELWQVLNPFHIPGLSKFIYFQVLKVVYKYLFKFQWNDQIINNSAEQDLELDFSGESCLYFSLFYDAMFDIIDQHAASKVVGEYIFTVTNIIILLKDSHILDNLDLNNKAHCQGKKPHYYYWMKETLRINEKNKNSKTQRVESLPKLKFSKKLSLEKLSPLSSFRKTGRIHSYLLEEIIQGRNKYLNSYHKGTHKK